MTEPVVSLTNVRQTAVVEKNLLQYERSDGFAQLRAALHYPQAQRYDLRRQEKRDDFLFVGLHQRPYHS